MTKRQLAQNQAKCIQCKTQAKRSQFKPSIKPCPRALCSLPNSNKKKKTTAVPSKPKKLQLILKPRECSQLNLVAKGQPAQNQAKCAGKMPSIQITKSAKAKPINSRRNYPQRKTQGKCSQLKDQTKCSQTKPIVIKLPYHQATTAACA